MSSKSDKTDAKLQSSYISSTLSCRMWFDETYSWDMAFMHSIVRGSILANDDENPIDSSF
jgi:hypothetical protein